MTLARLVTLTAILVTAALPAVAQEAFDFYARGPYRPGVPRPDALLGYAAGARHTQYAEQRRVLDALIAAAPDRVRTEVIGTTEEGREMRILIVSAPENLARLDDIRADLVRLADPRSTSAEAAAAIAGRIPVAVLLSYSIHGNEPAGFEAVMWVAYQLLASEEPATTSLLRHATVILNPSANPDGHERFAVWYNSLAVGTDEPFAYEWNEPWGIWGRYGHYRFDMNRDFVALSHEPTRAAVRLFRRWRPQVVVDHHSTTEQFFFPPVAEAVNQNFPARTIGWFETFGRGNAAAFDRFGWQYYSRDIFDFFYPGYFDVSPSLQGAIGMTYETDGGKALARRRDDGTVITLADGIAHHFVASLATIETAVANREQLLRDYYTYQRESLDLGRTSVMKRVVVLPEADATNAARLAAWLVSQGIEVTRLDEPYTSAAAHSYMAPAQRAERRTFPAGALVVDFGQPAGRHAKVLLEPRAEMDSAFVRAQLEKFGRNRRRGQSAPTEFYEFYDVSAWSLPYALGLDAYWTEDAAPVRGTLLAIPADADPVRALAPAGGATGRARSAYVFPNDRQSAAELALALLAEGFVINVSQLPLRADGRTYPRGTFVVRTNRNPDRLHDRISEMSRETRVPVTAAQSAFADSGQVGVGSESVMPVFRPRIAVAAGDGISATSYGALWYFLERELRQDFVPVALRSVGGMYTLADYNVFIVPSGSSNAIRRELGDGGIARLKQWVQDGGVLIAYGGAALFPAHTDVGLSTVRAVGADDDEETEEAKTDTLPSDPSLTPPLPTPAPRLDRPEELPGSIFRATLDRSHWLTLGYQRPSLPVMVSGTMLQPSKEGANPVAFVGDDLVLSGFVWPDNTERLLKGSAWAVAEERGRGSVVIFAEDPLFRAFWRGTARLLTNAVLFGPGR